MNLPSLNQSKSELLPAKATAAYIF
jgi:hypothetical protein